MLYEVITPAEINKNIPSAASLNGDLKLVLAELSKRVAVRARDEWNERVDELKTHVPAMYSKKTALHPKFVLEHIHERLGA